MFDLITTILGFIILFIKVIAIFVFFGLIAAGVIGLFIAYPLPTLIMSGICGYYFYRGWRYGA